MMFQRRQALPKSGGDCLAQPQELGVIPPRRYFAAKENYIKPAETTT
jgi:hypothetical protein